MSRGEDHFTSTVDGAAAFERARGMDLHVDDGPDWSDVYGESPEHDHGVFDGDQVVFSDGVPSGEPPS